MKKLKYGICFLLVAVVVAACSKYAENKNPEVISSSDNFEKNDSENEQLTAKVGPGIVIFTVEVHRKAGKFNSSGENCDCQKCLGFCDFVWFPDFKKTASSPDLPTVGLDFGVNNRARMYFLTDLSVKDTDLSKFYIDEKIDVKGNQIQPGEYNIVHSNGIIQENGVQYQYNSYIDVNYSI